MDARQVLGLVGGVFLLWLAWPTARADADRAPASAAARRGGLAGAYLSILGLTLTNPMTILSFGALFAGLGVTGGDDRQGRPCSRSASSWGRPPGGSC